MGHCKLGRKETKKAMGGRFAKTCFVLSVGVWSAKTGENTWFLFCLLDFLERLPGTHNPEAVGSSPTPATIKTPDFAQKEW